MVKGAQGSRTSRLWVGCAVVLAGLLAGYTVGRLSVLYATRTRMVDYAGQLLEHDEEIAAEIDATLVRANGSSATACSEDDVVLLRQLTFAARFIKDVGRLQDGMMRCTAAVGMLPTPAPLSGPDFTVPHGISIYRNRPLSLLGGASAEIVTLGRSDVVVSPDIFSEFSQRPLHYYYGVIDREHGVLHSRVLGAVSVPPNLLNARNPMQIGDELYAARCSKSFAVCVVVHASRVEIWQSNRALMAIYLITGTIAGLVCAVALAMAGHKRRSQTNQLKRAILLGKLSVAYQPIVELESHRIVGAEALARWTDEEGESIRPETIIALAEAEGFVSEITRFVLTRSLDELGTILEENPEFQLSINLAPSDMADPRLLLLLDEKLAERRIAPRNLTFELTERATSDRELAVAAIRRLRERGHSVYIDDFGTGYSNLAYLTELNVDGIKINRSFIATIGTDSVTASILPQILEVARALSLKVVVQGIERQEQAVYFATREPHILGQGWFFGMPIPARSLMYLCAEKTE